LPLVLVVAVSFSQNKRALFGEARFANSQEIAASGLLSDAGIIVGKWLKRYLMLPGQLFTILAAPTRSGKGVSFVVPNALNWPGTLVVQDTKEEVYKYTAGFRAKHGQAVYKFRPFCEDYKSARYNPLGYVRDGDFRIGDLISIGEVFYPSGGRDAFFDDQARNLFVGLGLLLCETPALPCTIGEMLRQSSGKGQPIKDYLQGIINQRNYREVEEVNKETGEITKTLVPIAEWDGEGLPPLSDECVDSINRFLSTSDNTRSSILASFNAPLLIWLNPIVDAATSANDFDLREIRKRPMSIYVCIPLNKLSEAGRLVGLLFSQLINENIKELPEDNPALKHECLLLMDEFTAIGKIPIFAKAIGYMAGFGLRAAIVIQSLSQLRSAYGVEDARTITTNASLQIAFAPKDKDDANDYSELLGYMTVKGKSISRRAGGMGGTPNETESDQKRALLLPQELRELSRDQQIIVMEGMKPILCEKIRYYNDPIYTARLLPPPSVPALDMDTHRAMTQGRTREMTLADVEGGIDLGRLALDMSTLYIPPDGEVSEADVKKLVDSFFSMLDESDCAEDGTCPPPSPDEMAALAAMLANRESINLEAYDSFEFDENPMSIEVWDDLESNDGILDLSQLTAHANEVKVSHVA
jgi:type IV secretion system protein VirD4